MPLPTDVKEFFASEAGELAEVYEAAYSGAEKAFPTADQHRSRFVAELITQTALELRVQQDDFDPNDPDEVLDGESDGELIDSDPAFMLSIANRQIESLRSERNELLTDNTHLRQQIADLEGMLALRVSQQNLSNLNAEMNAVE